MVSLPGGELALLGHSKLVSPPGHHEFAGQRTQLVPGTPTNPGSQTQSEGLALPGGDEALRGHWNRSGSITVMMFKGVIFHTRCRT